MARALLEPRAGEDQKFDFVLKRVPLLLPALATLGNAAAWKLGY